MNILRRIHQDAHHRSEVPRYYMCSRKTDLGSFGSGRVDHKLWGCSGTK